MTLKKLRLQIPRKLLEKIGLMDMLADLERVEVLNAYQYDQNNFFSLQNIRFKPGLKKFEKKILTEKLKAEYYQIFMEKDDEILCIMKQKRDTGFFPMFGQGPWAILFPITVSAKEIRLNLLAEEEYLGKLYESLQKFTSDYTVVGIKTVEDVKDLGDLPSPVLTSKQRDIVEYAAEHGYFESPKKISADELAEHFGISASAVNMHLKNTENIVMKYFFGGILSEEKEGDNGKH